MSMPPPYWPPNGVFGHNINMEDAADTRPCIDSPLETLQSAPSSYLEVHEAQRSKTMTSSTSPDSGDGRPLSARSKASGPRRTSSKGIDDGSNVRFFVVNHPEKLRDREELRKNRQHVMHDYLAKEAANPTSKDARVKGPGYSRKRKINSSSTGTSGNPLAPSNIFSQARSDRDPGQGNRERPGTDSPADSEPRANMSKALKVQRHKPPASNAPLVTGISGRFRNYSYLGTAPDDVPFPLRTMSGELNPFDTWPAFDDPSVNVNELKWSCSRRFGSRGIADYWVPTLLKARHAFLSTIAISSAHDDIMRRSTKTPDQRPKLESVERARVRAEVTSMINESIGDPQMQTADATLIAVVHLLNAEIMGCDDNIMYVHQKGLQSMVDARGGLNSLGVNGQLAVIITITMHLIAILRETQPTKEFLRFAQMQKTDPPKDFRPLPESPVYSRPLGYRTINKILKPDSQILRLLELDRQLTREFLSGQEHRYAKESVSLPELVRLRDEIFAMQTAEELDFKHLSERYTYEAIRLTSRVYAHALEKRIQFSQSADQLRESGLYRSLVPGYLSTEAKYIEDCAMHIHVRNALMRTDITDCWGHMAGVLFWIGLVAGAAANPGAAPEGYVVRRETGEDEEARKWLAAIVVRCSTVLGFEYGPAILETVKVMHAIQALLRPQAEEQAVDVATNGEHAADLYGPVAPSQIAQQGFSDFAWEFDS